ncbi:MAG: hypothetical protein HFH73_14220 [Lachnospiraceae bacterium]|nr:hypothetical protein [Lachnospiraceae bacterium]
MKNIRNNPAFRQMDPKKQQMVELLMNSLSGKQLNEVLPIITNWKNKMDQEGLTFTQAENMLLTEIFTSQMSPAQKSQYELIKQFMKKN